MLKQSRSRFQAYAMRGCRLSRRFFLCESCFQPRDVFLEALVVLQEAMAGQDEEIIAELRILKVDLKQPFISYGQDLSVVYALDRHGSSVVRRKEAKFAHDASWRMLDADFLDQKLTRDRQQHFVGPVAFLEQSVALAIFALGHERFEPFHRHIALRRIARLLDELEQLTETN